MAHPATGSPMGSPEIKRNLVFSFKTSHSKTLSVSNIPKRRFIHK